MFKAASCRACNTNAAAPLFPSPFAFAPVAVASPSDCLPAASARRTSASSGITRRTTPRSSAYCSGSAPCRLSHSGSKCRLSTPTLPFLSVPNAFLSLAPSSQFLLLVDALPAPALSPASPAAGEGTADGETASPPPPAPVIDATSGRRRRRLGRQQCCRHRPATSPLDVALSRAPPAPAAAVAAAARAGALPSAGMMLESTARRLRQNRAVMPERA